jgi:hypothetical protein
LRIQGVLDEKIKIKMFSYFSLDFKGEVFINDVSLENMTMTFIFRKDSMISCQRLDVHVLNIEDFTNDGKLRFLNLSPLEYLGDVRGPEVDIHLSNLGTADFYNFDFSKFTLNIVSSLMSSVVFMNVKWPTEILSRDQLLEPEGLESRRREIYRQIKSALSKQNNYVGEADFHQLEMDTYYKTLNWKDRCAVVAYSHLMRIAAQVFEHLCGASHRLSEVNHPADIVQLRA